MSRNPFQILGIPRTSTEKDIRSAYARLLKKIDQSKNPEKFIQLREAFDSAILSSKYDQTEFESESIDETDPFQAQSDSSLDSLLDLQGVSPSLTGNEEPHLDESENQPIQDEQSDIQFDREEANQPITEAEEIRAFVDKIFRVVESPRDPHSKLEALFSELNQKSLDYRLELEDQVIDRLLELAYALDEGDTVAGIRLKRLSLFLEGFFHWEEKVAQHNYRQASINSILQLTRSELELGKPSALQSTQQEKKSSGIGIFFWIVFVGISLARVSSFMHSDDSRRVVEQKVLEDYKKKGIVELKNQADSFEKRQEANNSMSAAEKIQQWVRDTKTIAINPEFSVFLKNDQSFRIPGGGVFQPPDENRLRVLGGFAMPTNHSTEYKLMIGTDRFYFLGNDDLKSEETRLLTPLYVKTRAKEWVILVH